MSARFAAEVCILVLAFFDCQYIGSILKQVILFINFVSNHIKSFTDITKYPELKKNLEIIETAVYLFIRKRWRFFVIDYRCKNERYYAGAFSYM